MKVEFQCAHCQSVLRVDQASIGKMARCPSCGNLTKIEEKPLFAEPVQVASDFSGQGNFDAPTIDSSNPYRASAAPLRHHELTFQEQGRARKKLSVPVITLMVIHGIGLVFAIFGMVGGIIIALDGRFGEDAASTVIVYMISVMLHVFCIFCGSRMLRAKNYVLCIVGSVVSIFSGVICCFLPTIFGIWTLIVLVLPDVILLFKVSEGRR